MTSWVGSISFEQRDNWEICKRESLFGSNTRTALGVRAGDELVIWGSQQGWLARCRATADARAPRGVEEVPWPEPEKYTALIPMEVLNEPRRPVAMSGAEIQRTVGIGTVRLPQFPRIDIAHSEQLIVLLSDDGGPQRTPGVVAFRTDPLPVFEGERGTLLDALVDLRTDLQLGAPAPYQQLVLLWSLVSAGEGRDRISSFTDVRDELRTLLAPFAVGASRPDPELPWFALRTSPWWQLYGDAAEAQRRGGRDFVRRMDPAAGLSLAAFNLVRTDDAFRAAAAQQLSAPLRDHPQRAVVDDLVARAGASTLSPAPPVIDVVAPGSTVVVDVDGPLVPGRVYDRDAIHESARRTGLPPGKPDVRDNGRRQSAVRFLEPLQGPLRQPVDRRARRVHLQRRGQRQGHDESSGGNRALIDHEVSGGQVSVFIKTRRDGSAWMSMGRYVVTGHEWGVSDGQDGVPRRDLRFRLRAHDVPALPDPDLPVLPVPPPPPARSEALLWDALERRGQTGERRRATVVRRDRRMSDPLKTEYVMERAVRYGGACELCGQHPGWVGDDGRPHLQAHHICADIDLVDWIAALCGTCHDRMHHARERAGLPQDWR